MAVRPPFIDAHVHFWDLQKIRYPWLMPPFGDDGPNGSVEAIAKTFLPQDYYEDAEAWDIRGLVHVEAGAHPDDAVAETEWVQSIAEGLVVPTAIVAFAALDRASLDSVLAAHSEHANVRGIRQIANWHAEANRTYTARDMTIDSSWQSGFGLLKQYDLSFDLQAYPGQFENLAGFLRAHEDTPVILNHTGMMVGERGAQTWRHGMRCLAELPNVFVKLSGMGFAFRPWHPDQARQYILEAIDIFGVERAMFASDFPTDKLFGSFDDHLDTYLEIVADFSEREQRLLFAGNANRVYRLNCELA